MNHYIIGTAGHVDHGKTELIRALTGQNTDRLKEEQERGISIELGFASLTLPSGSQAGIVDVPGHEKFIRQMLAGIGGIDMVLLVIAADEGVMPQTKEHLDIIDLLQVRKGLIVLNKIDLVEEDWRELVKLEVQEAVVGSVLQAAPIVEVSALKGQGIKDLIVRIDQELAGLPSREHYGPCRLPIDRAFSLPGLGTIVTGTMYQGSLRVGDTVLVEPGNHETRVRSLQVHGHSVSEAFAGQRVAANLPNLTVADVQHGANLLSQGFLSPAQTLDVSLRYLSSADKPLVQRQRIRVHIGTQEVMGRVYLLDREEVEAGQQVYAQLLLEDFVIADRGDRFVIRQYSPLHTIGGGTVLDRGNRKYKRYQPAILEQLAIKEQGSPKEMVNASLQKATQPVTVSDLAKSSGLSSADVEWALTELGEGINVVYVDEQPYWFKKSVAEGWLADLLEFLKGYQQKYPLRLGVSKEEIKSKFFLRWSPKLFTAFMDSLVGKNVVHISGSYVGLAGFKPGPTGNLASIVPKILHDYDEAQLAPPDWNNIMAKYKIESAVAPELLQFLLREGCLIKIGQDTYFASSSVQLVKQVIEQLLVEEHEFSATVAKERLNTSRKYLIPLLEYMDSIKLTRRVGDKRIRY